MAMEEGCEPTVKFGVPRAVKLPSSCIVNPNTSLVPGPAVYRKSLWPLMQPVNPIISASTDAKKLAFIDSPRSIPRVKRVRTGYMKSRSSTPLEAPSLTPMLQTHGCPRRLHALKNARGSKVCGRSQGLLFRRQPVKPYRFPVLMEDFGAA